MSCLLSKPIHLTPLPREEEKISHCLLVNVLLCLSKYLTIVNEWTSARCNCPPLCLANDCLVSVWAVQMPRHQEALTKSGTPARVLIYLSMSGLKPVYLIKGMSEEL